MGVLKLALLCKDSHSLKEKRAVVRSLKSRIEQRFGLAVAEVGALDTWQRIELGVALAASERDHASETLGQIIGFVRGLGIAELIDDRREVIAFGDDPAWGSVTAGELAAAAERTGAGDKVGADDWIPPAWREEAER